MIDITFDPAKDERTRRERGFSLALGAEVVRNVVALGVDDRFDYGEVRMIAYGYVGPRLRLHVCVYTVRGENLHVISVRKATTEK